MNTSLASIGSTVPLAFRSFAEDNNKPGDVSVTSHKQLDQIP